MTIFWVIYYLILLVLSATFAKLFKSIFLKFLYTPIFFSIFGSIWFIAPGSPEIAPIISIFFLENTILDSNGINRLIRPLVSFLFFFEIISFIFYFSLKRNNF